jgi:hypothetical protein
MDTLTCCKLVQVDIANILCSQSVAALLVLFAFSTAVKCFLLHAMYTGTMDIFYHNVQNKFFLQSQAFKVTQCR